MRKLGYMKKTFWYTKLMFSLVILLFGFSILKGDAEGAGPAIKIGVIGPMKSPIGQHQWNGAQLAAEEINATGGIKVKGVPHAIQLIKADSNEFVSVTDAVSAMSRLTTVDKVDFMVGTARSEAILAMQEVMADQRKILIGSYANHPELCARLAKNYDRYKYWFRATGVVNAIEQAKMFPLVLDVVGRHVRNELGVERPRVALLVEKIMGWDALLAGLKKIVPQLNMEIVGEWRPSAHANDVTAELTAIRNSEAHIIFDFSTGAVSSVYPRQWGELQIPSALIGYAAEAAKQDYWKTSGGLCEYQIIVAAVTRVATTPKTIPFFDKYVKKFGEAPLITADVYDNIYILKEAIERSDTLDNEAVVLELEKTNYVGTFGRVEFNPRGHNLPHDLKFGAKYVYYGAGQWKNGKLVAVWPDGRAVNPVIGAGPGWEEIKPEGTVELKLPPWMVKYWKSKKGK